MARQVRIVWRLAGFREIRTSPGVTADISARVERIEAACGEGYEGETTSGRNRARGGVFTATAEAMVDNARNNTLVRNLGAGR